MSQVERLKDAFLKSFDETWPSNKNRRRCPACSEWTLFKRWIDGKLRVWACCHMEGAEYCGYSEEIES